MSIASFANLSVASPTSQLILQSFRLRFTYVKGTSPTIPSEPLTQCLIINEPPRPKPRSLYSFLIVLWAFCSCAVHTCWKSTLAQIAWAGHRWSTAMMPRLAVSSRELLTLNRGLTPPPEYERKRNRYKLLQWRFQTHRSIWHLNINESIFFVLMRTAVLWVGRGIIWRKLSQNMKS